MAEDKNGALSSTYLRTSDLSRLTGIPVTTLRYWCDQNLLSPYVTPSGHRLFEEHHVGEVQSIQRLRKVQGLSITAVKSAIPAPVAQRESKLPGMVEGDETGETGETGTVGQKLRQLRLNAKLTLRDVSQATGLSQSALASIERTSLGVGIPEAKALAKHFGVTLTELMTREPAKGSSEFVTSAAGGPMEATLGSGLRIERLASGRDMMDCQRWYIEPGVGSHGAYDHEGEEFIYVLLGRLSLAIDGREPLTLAQGESIYFRSSLRHAWHNPGNTTTVLLWVNTPPTF